MDRENKKCLPMNSIHPLPSVFLLLNYKQQLRNKIDKFFLYDSPMYTILSTSILAYIYMYIQTDHVPIKIFIHI